MPRHFSIMTRYLPLSLAVLLLLLVVTPASAFAFAAPDPTTALSPSSMKSEVHGIVDSFHHYHHSIAQMGENDYERELKRGTIWQGLTMTETFVFTSIVTTRTIFKKKTIRKTKTTWKTKTAKSPRSLSAIISEESVPSDGGVVTSTTTVTVTTTADTTRRGRVKRHKHGVRFNGLAERAEITTAWTVTSTALTKEYKTATKTKYTATITKFIATTTRFTTITPSINVSSSSATIVSGMPARVFWVTVTETTSVMPSSFYDTSAPKKDPVNKGAIIGGVIAGVVAIAGLIGACFFMRRRTNKRFSQRKSFNQDTTYSSVSLGDDMVRPEAEGLMGGGPLTPGTPAAPGLYSPELVAPPPPIPNFPIVIPPSSSTSLHTNPSPTQATNPAIAEVAFPAPAGRRQENYTHLSPPIASEFRSPGTTTTPRRPRGNSLLTNIMPPPLQQYTATRTASGATTLRQEGTGNHSRSSSLYSQDDGAGGADAVREAGRYTDAPPPPAPTTIAPETQKETGVYVEGFVSPLTPPMLGAKWDIGDRIRKAASPSATPLPYERPRSPDLEMQQREYLLRQGEHQGY
ncbi:hypothetical protein BDD12DRAFT_821559 [Trichophaea hybrida]|nr:hypothetical protein BDD12DRAFT_821559 [Trichophaea hybrida]